MIKKIAGILLAFLILLHALLIQSGISNLVLCFGNDGHIAIEAIVPSESNNDSHNCIHLIEFQSEKNKQSIQSSDCLDIQLKSQLTDIIIKQVEKLKINLIYTCFITIYTSEISNALITGFVNKNNKPANSILRSIKTIVLQL